MKTAFEKFMLDNDVDIVSISSYFSYVKKAYEKFLPKDLKKYGSIYDRLLLLNRRSCIKYCEYLISILKAEIKDPTSTHSEKTLRNYSSGVTMLKRFLNCGGFTGFGSKTFSKTFAVSYEPKEIIDNFIFRLESQDRIYPATKNCFPCRLLGRIFRNNKATKKIYLDMLNNCLFATKFLVNDKKDYLYLSQIDSLDIVGGIKIWSKGKSYDIFTEVIKKKTFLGCVKTSAKLLEDLSLDHDEPQEVIVNREIYGLPTLKKLSDAFWTHHISSGLSGSKLTTSFINTQYAKLNLNENELLKEVIYIYKFVNFTIMDGNYNSGLGNSIIVTPPLGKHIN